METNISKAQLEVWEWKNRLYEEIKDLPENEQLKYIINKVKKTVEEIKRKKKLNSVS